MVKTSILFLMISCQSVFGQMLDNRTGDAFTDKPFFNQEFIRENKVHVINGAFTYKKPGDKMRETAFKYVYEFDSLGRLVSSFETRRDDGTLDTTRNIYLYNADNLLVEHKKGDGKGFTATTYEYNGAGLIVRESNVREYWDSLGFTKRTILNSETMTYENYGQQIKKTIFNSYGLPYLNEFIYYNDLGYLVERVERLIMTSEVITHKYIYNEKGYIAAIRTYRFGIEKPSEEIVYLYDEHGNLLDKHLYRNGVFITEIEMLYNDKSKLLTYVLTRDVATNFIMILGFKDYRFF